MFNTICLQYKIVPVEYFLDKMQEWEISNIIDNIENVDRLTWEQTRLLMYITAQVNSTKKLKVNDIIKFPWETKLEQKEIERQKSNIKLRKDITKEEIDALQKKARLIQEKYIVNGKYA